MRSFMREALRSEVVFGIHTCGNWKALLGIPEHLPVSQMQPLGGQVYIALMFARDRLLFEENREPRLGAEHGLRFNKFNQGLELVDLSPLFGFVVGFARRQE